MGHSSAVSNFVVTDQGIKILKTDTQLKQSHNGDEKAHGILENGTKHKSKY
jgi:hypothetical protein